MHWSKKRQQWLGVKKVKVVDRSQVGDKIPRHNRKVLLKYFIKEAKKQNSAVSLFCISGRDS